MAFDVDDTIVAVATPPGRGGLAVVRLSGPEAVRIARELTGGTTAWPPRRAVYTPVDAGMCVTDAVVTWFQAPASFTGEDVVELAVAGNPLLAAGLVERAVGAGARVARPGEFTFRAYLGGKIDLAQAEALDELVRAVSPAQLEAASKQLQGGLSRAIAGVVEALRALELLLEASVDFPDEGYRFIERDEVGRRLVLISDRLRELLAGARRSRLVHDGLTVVIAGATNVGKSSLFNALVGADRAIVTPVPGTTRDLISERLLLEGRLVRLVDSAGLREAPDPVEQEGIRRAESAMGSADLVLLAMDGSRPIDPVTRARWDARKQGSTVAVVTKCDLPAAWTPAEQGIADAILVSSLTGHGIHGLAAALSERLGAMMDAGADQLVTNERHRGLLREALDHVDRSHREFEAQERRLPEEFLLEDLRSALGALSDVTGRRSAEELLQGIFATFCIGK